MHGIKRRASLFNTYLSSHYGDRTDTSNPVRILQETQLDEIYNLGAQTPLA